ncbi:hypothetical protein HYALB_00011190 [Hymenoscyphus albidus]|uniref:Uncharacterized protein n=1 Tax=Hymenoscyphus albidus TaxID=595503 RepID=A0A9N9PXX8_9HELO|nr:hypothetical protein HYALB_00011190 [Hymenoscyphus albidus]
MVQKEAVLTDKAPAPLAFFSQAIKCQGMVYCSGSIGVDPATGKIVETGIQGRTEQILKNLAAVLEAAGSSIDNCVKGIPSHPFTSSSLSPLLYPLATFKRHEIPTHKIKVNVFITKMENFAAMNEVYAKVFTKDPKPVRTCVAVFELPLGTDVEIDGDNWVFWVPRALSDDERYTLLSRRYLRRFNRPRQEPAPPAFAHTSIQHNHILRTILPVERLGAPSLERCRAFEIILISWFPVAVVSLGTGLWRSFATGGEGKGFTDAAWVVATGSVVLLAVQKIHDRRCKLVRLGVD